MDSACIKAPAQIATNTWGCPFSIEGAFFAVAMTLCGDDSVRMTLSEDATVRG